MYQLTAQMNNNDDVAYLFEASSDDEASMIAVGYIMDTAYADKAGPWAKGRIELRDPNGNIIRTMDAK